jgi:membrane peptidoglycan carboxypeptidase
VLDEKVAFLINDMLSDNNARLLTFGANSLLNMGGRPVAVKTGTTNDRRDNWAIGWSPTTIVGVWVGNNDNSPMKSVASGVSGASPIWRRIMLEALGLRPASPFEKPDGVDQVQVDAVSGYPEHDGFASRSEYVISGTLPSLPDPIHTKLKLCGGQNRLATAGQVAGGTYEEKEFFVFKEDDPFASAGVNKWQEGIDAWLSTQGDARYNPPTEFCEGGASSAVRVNSPVNERNYDGNEIEVDIDVIADKSIEKVDIMVDGSRKETLTSRPFRTKINLSPGSYELRGRATLEGGEVVESGVLKIGVGGIGWDGVNLNATPVPNASPSPTPNP